MPTPLQCLIDLPHDYDPYEPKIERAPMERLIRKPVTEKEELQAKARSTALLFSHGMEATMDDTEEFIASQQFHQHVQQFPMSTNKLNTPGIVLKLSALMSEYDYEVTRDAAQLRQYVTNRLIEESDPKMPASQRMRALENLGKITEVGLFTERTEITVKTMPIENLEARLHERLLTLLPSEYTEIVQEQKPEQIQDTPEL